MELCTIPDLVTEEEIANAMMFWYADVAANPGEYKTTDETDSMSADESGKAAAAYILKIIKAQEDIRLNPQPYLDGMSPLDRIKSSKAPSTI